MSEFSLIEKYFKPLQGKLQYVDVGIGDDCAVVSVPSGFELAMSMDTLVEGIHFFPDVNPEDLGYKALAVNLSDLAAMGAMPKWFTLSVTLPEENEAWLQSFCSGMQDLIKQYPISLIGGDTTRGPLSITIQVHGMMREGQRLLRSTAKVGDKIFVSGLLGDAGLALNAKMQKIALSPEALASVESRLLRPEPRLSLGRLLLASASSMIDLSDGLIGDLGHLAKASGVAAEIFCEKLPLSKYMQAHVDSTGDFTLPLSAGDDYELCFTVPPTSVQTCRCDVKDQAVAITEVGRIVPGSGVTCLLNGEEVEQGRGYQHF